MIRRLIAGSLLTVVLEGCAGVDLSRGPKLSLSWVPAAGADEYVIERGEGESFSEVARVPASRTTYVDRSVRAGILYCYRVRAKNSRGLSSPSPTQCRVPKT